MADQSVTVACPVCLSAIQVPIRVDNQRAESGDLKVTVSADTDHVETCS